jgi:hypothetical protein
MKKTDNSNSFNLQAEKMQIRYETVSALPQKSVQTNPSKNTGAKHNRKTTKQSNIILIFVCRSERLKQENSNKRKT